MPWRTWVATLGGALACVALCPSGAYAQSAIAGTVRDTSGAVIPGVTVEAASPVLIEKERSVVTDQAGQYKIVGSTQPLERQNQLDLGVSKAFQMGKKRVQASR